jgi:hypothetical protein
VKRVIPPSLRKDRAPFLFLPTLGGRKEIIRSFGICQGGEKAAEGAWLGGQSHVAGRGVSADVDFLALEAKGGRQTPRLAASVLE